MSGPQPPAQPVATPPVQLPGAPPPPAPAVPPPSGFKKALQHTGIPPSVLNWKPRLPSRNWTIFLTLVGSVSYAYYYDRQECKRLKQEYQDRVRYLSEQRIEEGPLGFGRKVTVYAAKWPEDDDWERGLQYFKRYIKPVLVAAAVDYDMVSCPQYGSLARHVTDHILTQRRRQLDAQFNLDPSLEPPVEDILAGLPGQLSVQQKEQRRIDGGALIIGRHSLKEYLQGLRRGFMEGIHKEAREKEVARLIEGDGVFETKEELEAKRLEEAEAGRKMMDGRAQGMVPPASSLPNPVSLGPASFLSRPPPTATPATDPNAPAPVDPETLVPESAKMPPNPLPKQPTLLLVPWVNHLGFKQIPSMVLDWFTERYKYKAGGEAALELIFGRERDFVGTPYTSGGVIEPTDASQDRLMGDTTIDMNAATTTTTTTTTPEQHDQTNATSDLDFDLDSESYYKSAFADFPSNTSKARDTYYADLAGRIKTARELASGARDPTPDETTKPPANEQQLREERLKKEVRWRNQEDGWEMIKPGSRPAWDKEWAGWVKVYASVREEDLPPLPKPVDDAPKEASL